MVLNMSKRYSYIRQLFLNSVTELSAGFCRLYNTACDLWYNFTVNQVPIKYLLFHIGMGNKGVTIGPFRGKEK